MLGYEGIEEFYKDVCCDHHHPIKLAANDGNDGIIDDFLKQLLDGKVGGEKLHTELYLDTAKNLTEAMTKAMGDFDYQDPENRMSFFIRHNLHVFAAAKTYSEQKALGNLLLDANGKLKNFKDFKTDAASIVRDYNKVWLRTEYDTIIAGAQMAAKWGDLQRNKDTYPYIEYRTVGDDRVRPAHHLLDGKVYAIDDPVWNTIYPPNGWRCRCTVIPSKDTERLMPENESGKSIRGMVTNPIFQNNVGKSMEIFNDSHPYFKDAKGKVSEMSAERNYGMRSFDKIYKDTSKFPAIPTAMDKQGFDDYWNQNEDKDGNITPKDMFDNSIRFDKAFYNHLFDKPKENRYEFAANFSEVLLNPDEVWDTFYTAKRVKYIPTRVFFKFYEDAPVALVTEMQHDGSYTAKTMYKITDVSDKKVINPNRKGILLHKNSR